MGTRGFIGMRDETRTVLTYNHFDSYPTGLGATAVAFVRGITDLDAVREQFKNVMLVDETGAPTDEQLEKLPTVDGSIAGDWYGVLRDLQGDLAGYLAAGVMPVWEIENPDAPLASTDSWLEWGYIVDVSREELEVYVIEHGKTPTRIATHTFAELAALDTEATSTMLNNLESVEV